MLRRNPVWLKALRPRATESSTVSLADVRAWFRKRRDTPSPMNPTDCALIMNQRRRSESYNDRRALLCYLHELSHGGDGVVVPYEEVGSETGQVAGEGHHAPREREIDFSLSLSLSLSLNTSLSVSGTLSHLNSLSLSLSLSLSRSLPRFLSLALSLPANVAATRIRPILVADMDTTRAPTGIYSHPRQQLGRSRTEKEGWARLETS